MGFRKTHSRHRQSDSSPDVYCSFFPISEEVKSGDEAPKKIIKLTKVTQEDLSKLSSLPRSEDYKLQDLLDAGIMPEKVNVSGMLDSYDELDSSIQSAKQKTLENVLSFEDEKSSVDEPDSASAPVDNTIVEPDKISE